MGPRVTRSVVTILVLAVFWAWLGMQPAGAATVRFVSTTGVDTGNCTLSPCLTIGYAITQSVSGDTISVAAGTYAERVVIDRSLKIVGAGVGQVAVDGANGGTVVTIGSPSASLDVAISGLTVQNGLAQIGGGIASIPGSGRTNTVALTRMAVTSNSAEGAADSGADASGGGIYNAAGSTMNLSVSTVSANSAVGGSGGSHFGIGDEGGAGLGSGIFNAGSLWVLRSTISGNSAVGGEGGAGQPNGRGGAAQGGGLYVATGGSLSTTLANTTVSANEANGGNGGCSLPCSHGAGPGGVGRGGGIESAGEPEVLLNDTIAANSTRGGSGLLGQFAASYGGGIDVVGSVKSKNTIVAENSAMIGLGGGGPDCYGTVTSGGHNLLGDDSSCSGFTADGDLVNVDPLLGPLQNNGGPTQTKALLDGSPAIDAADDAACAAPPVNGKDQRGVSRPQGPHCDMGAYEKR
jgi:hypothetical protein